MPQSGWRPGWRRGRAVADKTDREKAQRLVADNRKAHHDYHILETFEAGMVLVGTEVKAIREGRVNLRDSFARVDDGEVFVFNVHISPYSHRGYAEHEPLRRRKLLLHRTEIRKLIGKTVEKGMTLVPLRMYFKDGRVKLAVGLAKGKKDYDRRETDQAARVRARDAGRDEGEEALAGNGNPDFRIVIPAPPPTTSCPPPAPATLRKQAVYIPLPAGPGRYAPCGWEERQSVPTGFTR